MEPLSEIFTVGHTLKLVAGAVAVGLLVRLAQFVCQKAGTPISRSEGMFLGLGVVFFLLITRTINDTLTAITYATVIVGGFTATKLSTKLSDSSQLENGKHGFMGVPDGFVKGRTPV